MRAWELHDHGWKQKDIAAALGVTEGAVRECVQEGQDAGSGSLATSASAWGDGQIES